MDQALAIQDGRARLKMSQEHLASAAGISARTVVRAESGFRVSGESLRNMCAVLGLDSSSIAPVVERAGIEETPSEPSVRDAADRVEASSMEAGGSGPGVSGIPVGPVASEPVPEANDALWRRLLGLRKAPVIAALFVLSIIAMTLGFVPIMARVVVLGDVGRWIVESDSSKAAAAYVNAIAAGGPARRPMLYYTACAQDEAVWMSFVRVFRDGTCKETRYDILVETADLKDGGVQTIIGPVGRDFGRDLARRLSGDPAVGWKVAFASGRQASGLAWFDPRMVPTQDMPRPPDSPSTWIYVTMTRTGDGR